MAKSTKAEVNRRVHEVVKLICAAKTNSYIFRFCSDEWGVTQRQAENYLAKAREVIKADYSIERSEFLASRIALLDKIAEKSIAQGQNSNAVGALRLQAELTRLLDKD